MSTYVYDNAWEQERARLAGLEAMYDDAGRAAIEQTGLKPGWTCLEVGGGGGSMAAWLCEQTGATGRVVATDLDTRFLEAIEHPALEVRKHDIVNDDLEAAGTFDLIHSRCLLEHLPSRDEVMRKLMAALKPGGWLVLEDFDFAPLSAEGPMPIFPLEGEPLFRKVNETILQFMTAAGYDGRFARALPREMIAAGLEDAGASVCSTLVRGGGVASQFFSLTIEQVGDAIVASGAMTRDEVEETKTFVNDPASGWMSVPLVSAWGRKPG